MLNIKERNYFLVTAHRSENVDKKERIKGILKGLELVSKRFKLPIIYPIHPRAEKMIKKFKLKVSRGVRLIKPVGYLDFLKLEVNARLILTDSGGIQEEACILKVPCVTLRDNTERPETIDVGSNLLVGANPQKILKSSLKMLKQKRNWKNPFGQGNASEQIINILEKELK